MTEKYFNVGQTLVLRGARAKHSLKLWCREADWRVQMSRPSVKMIENYAKNGLLRAGTTPTKSLDSRDF